MPEVRCSLFYSPQLDRLIGGDFFRDFQGRLVKSSLMSLARANSVNAATHELDQAYTESFEGIEGEPPPFPVVLAIIAVGGFPIEVDGQQQMAPVQELFTLRQLAGAPAEYRDLAQLLTVVTDRATLRDRMPATVAECSALATQLFRIVGCAHRLPATFGRNGGCNLRPDSITPAGGLNDLYFLTRPDSVVSQTAELPLSQRNDLLNALSSLLEVTTEASVPLEEMLARAVEAYASPGADALFQCARDAARRLSGLPYTSSSAGETIASLADSMLENLSSS